MRLFKSNCWTRCSQMSYVAILELSVMFASFPLPAHAQGKQRPMQYPTVYRTIHIDGLSIFYREAGPKDAPILLLLHGLPSSSRMFEPLFARLSESETIRVHVRPLRRDHESFHRSARTLVLHAVHAGLRWPCGFSDDPGSS